MALSQKALSRGPQLGDGDNTRSFLCGKNNDVNEWKIYEVYWEQQIPIMRITGIVAKEEKL